MPFCTMVADSYPFAGFTSNHPISHSLYPTPMTSDRLVLPLMPLRSVSSCWLRQPDTRKFEPKCLGVASRDKRVRIREQAKGIVATR